MTLQCQHGPDNHLSVKRKYQAKIAEADNKDHPPHIKRRLLIQDTYKLDCRAQVTIERRLVFDQFKLPKVSKHFKRQAGELIANICNGREEFILSIPSLSQHNEHFQGKNSFLGQ
ncbi:uncharacterized protein [Watersipora subatra]|uniref:uncharacterized protein isoform X2 n=1 Tax=Watersipora subatra TaxID=2589382 RepID=UPI00355C1089